MHLRVLLRWRSALLLSALLLSSALANAQSVPPRAVVINEVMYDPPEGGASNEWVEVINRSNETIDLADLQLRDEVNAPVPIASTSTPLPPGAIAVLVRDANAFASTYPEVDFLTVSGFPGLNNSGDRPALVTIDGSDVDAVPYEPSWGGSDAALERLDPDGPSDDASNFRSADPPEGTPGSPNDETAPDTTPPTLSSVEVSADDQLIITFSEPVTAATAGTITNYSVSDGIGTPQTAEPSNNDPARVLLTFSEALPGPRTYTLTVTGIADTAGNVLEEDTAAFNVGTGEAAEVRDMIVNEILYDPPASSLPGEYVELLNRSQKTLDLSTLTLSDAAGDADPVTDTPALIGPGEYAVIVQDGDDFAAAFPEVPHIEHDGWDVLNNSGDAVVLRAGNTTIDSVAYRPSWGGSDAALERLDPEGPSNSATNFATTTAAIGTPNAQNSVFAPDTTPPALLDATSVDARTVHLLFSEPVTEESATDPSVYAVTPDRPIADAVRNADDSSTVILTLGTPLPDRQTASVLVSGISDLAGNVQTKARASFFVGRPDTPVPGEVVLSEVMFDPATGSTGEYVEIVNATLDRLFDLSDLALGDAPEDDPDQLARDQTLLRPGEFVALASDPAAVQETFPDATIRPADVPGLSNSGDTILLFLMEEDEALTLDSLTYDPRWHRPELDDATGISLERRLLTGFTNDPTIWTSSLSALGGTPGSSNSVTASPVPNPDGAGVTVLSPFHPDAGESAVIRYTLRAPSSLVRARIFDSAGRVVRVLEQGHFTGDTGTLLWDGRGNDGRRLRVGLYVVLLEAVDVAAGVTEAYRAPVVLARPL